MFTDDITSIIEAQNKCSKYVTKWNCPHTGAITLQFINSDGETFKQFFYQGDDAKLFKRFVAEGFMKPVKKKK